ncbi:hypothetical protein [Mammaliicoccus stepanovicii]|uniref:Uncharacterized protein n=1 Tax=Mammaliicoccus stepanovicii TaxID=643214 RepID=A0A239YJB9_9STAP|nr:hypothetical protein [Mammaliicoccus stepanovicii]GGI40889.1 hypothetical protein GCM10010896_10620 [Mammaliicoccus stepanovicii]SNV58496.1 Uncharacterised protein [Mammaliicoccus stepanovicii]
MFKFFKRKQQNNTDSTDNNNTIELEGMTLVDAYYIKEDEVSDYIKDRERYSDVLIYVLKQHFPTVERMLEGTDDGEAIVAFHGDEPMRCIYLNPETIDLLRELELEVPLKQAVERICDLN